VNLIETIEDDAIALLQHSSRQSEQRLTMHADGELLGASRRSGELLEILRRFGDPATEFVWRLLII